MPGPTTTTLEKSICTLHYVFIHYLTIKYLCLNSTACNFEVRYIVVGTIVIKQHLLENESKERHKLKAPSASEHNDITVFGNIVQHEHVVRKIRLEASTRK